VCGSAHDRLPPALADLPSNCASTLRARSAPSVRDPRAHPNTGPLDNAALRALITEQLISLQQVVGRV
jgi:hypothetical protein